MAAGQDEVCFSSKMITDLQYFLKERGVTESKIKKDKLVKLCEAVNRLNLSIDPDLLSVTSANDVGMLKQTLSLLGCDDDLFTMTGFTDDMNVIPDFTLYDIFNYLVNIYIYIGRSALSPCPDLIWSF